MRAEIQDASISEPTQSRIVVGVDGSPTSIEALEWAVREAQLRGATLEVTHVTFVPDDVLELETLTEFSQRERSSIRLWRRPSRWRQTSGSSLGPPTPQRQRRL
jgi:nucleotide-binding universal stress UspA family protein